MTNLIKLTQGKFTLVDDEDCKKTFGYKWCVLARGYVGRTITVKDGHKRTIYLHNIIMPKKVGFEIDHINRNKLDNRKNNLRYCSRSQNIWNRGIQKSNTSGFNGVTWHKRIKKWQVRIAINNKRLHLGYFSDIKLAADTYNAYATSLHGKFASLNII